MSGRLIGKVQTLAHRSGSDRGALRQEDAERAVASAYREALGRDPDPVGSRDYARQVRAGRSHEDLVRELAASREGVMHAARTLGFAVDGRSDDEFVEDLYQLATGRPADDAGRRWLGQMLDQGADRLSVTMTLAHSEEALNRQLALRTHIQDLRELRPASFRTVPGTDGVAREVYRADTAEDVDWMEESILEHGYYEKPGIWSLSVDDDKRRMSALLASFAPTRALEIGCSSGTVMEGLLAAGVDCDGLEISRMAIQRADPAVRPRIHRADLLDADLTDGYDLIYGLDVLEHLNPNRFDRYLVRLRELVSDTGYVYVNSPAFGVDDVYGEEFPLVLPSWQQDGAAGRLFREWLVDEDGYPAHGHLVWACSPWWEAAFSTVGLHRDKDVERALHARWDGAFASESPARRAFFVFTASPGSERSSEILAALVGP